VNNVCAAELATVLGCWAATDDYFSKGSCIDATKNLFECMRSTVRIFPLLYMALGLMASRSRLKGNSTDQALITTLLDWGRQSNKPLSYFHSRDLLSVI
jgi:hypothetical protein